MESQIQRLLKRREEDEKFEEDEDEEDVTISVLDLNTLKEEEEDVPKWRTPPKIKETRSIPEWRYNDDGMTIREKKTII